MKGKVLCGMSGGVDSSVSACLLKEQGYDVVGCTMRLFDNEDIGAGMESSCCSLRDVDDAKSVCYRLGLQHYVFNFAEDFRRTVMQPFADSYLHGLTPNPCINCNRYMKFGKLVSRAREIEMDYVATGHYGQIVQENGRWLLKKSVDTKKDQTYFLYNLTQEQMAHFLLPLGGLTKGTNVVEMASGYATLANGGQFRTPTCIVKITDAFDNLLVDNTGAETTQVYTDSAARAMTNILEGVMKSGTGSRLSLNDMPSAGKTGTTNDNKDGWFVGYTAYYTTAVWAGCDQVRALNGLSGSSYPGTIWNQFMETIHQGLEKKQLND